MYLSTTRATDTRPTTRPAAVPLSAVFIASFALAIIGLLILWFFVNPGTRNGTPQNTIDLRGGLNLLRHRTLRRVTLAAAMLGACTVDDMFLYLALQQQADLTYPHFARRSLWSHRPRRGTSHPR